MEIKIKGYTINPNPIHVGMHSLIYSGMREFDHKDVMVKLLSNEYPTQEEILRFKQEYEISKLFMHEENIIQVYALEPLGNGYGIIMENIFMPTLNTWLERDKKIDLAEFLALAIQMSSALAHIHQKNIIHKDINPSNILCAPHQKDLIIIDFGLAVNLPKEHTQIVNPNVLEGKLGFLSPEQTGRMNRGIDYRSDFYSLGITFYQMLTGKVPFDTEDPLELVHSHIAIVPPSPKDLHPEIPTVLSDIVMKLLAKKAEDRYQNAYGLLYDLKICQKKLLQQGKIPDFNLGKKDVYNRFLISEKIYGRSQEINTLLHAYTQVVQGKVEFMLIDGYSGIGKTSLVREIHKPIVKEHGYFISGKFDQLKHTIPYSAMSEAFNELITQILSEPEEKIRALRQKILKAVGNYGQLITEVIPNLSAIIGKQPKAPETGPTERLHVYSHIFQKLIPIFSTQEHPLVLFLDDLQWADAPSLKMIESLLSSMDLGYLFIIGAYRSNEMSAGHPLIASRDNLKKLGIMVNSIALGPITLDDTKELLADTLHQEKNLIDPLALLVYEKTKGNPFFIIQILQSLYKEEYLYFDIKKNKWSWDLRAIQARKITDNVIDLMVDNIKELPDYAKIAMQYAACIGNQFSAEVLGSITQKTEEEILAILHLLLQKGYIIREGNSHHAVYHFAHDRIQQAAYSFLEENEKKHIHLDLAQLLSKQRAEAFFDIVNHFNHALDIAKEKKYIAELNLKASLAAKDAAAFEPALEYIEKALQCADESLWQHDYPLMFSLYDQAAKSAFLCGKHDLSEEYAQIALKHANSLLDKLKITQTQVFSSVAQMKQARAVDLALKILAEANIVLPKKPKLYHVLYYVLKTKWLLRNKPTAVILESKEMQDETKKLIIPLIASVFSSAYQTEQNYFAIFICLAVQLSVLYGNTQTSAVAYACFGIILCGVLMDIESGYQFGELSQNLIEKLWDEDSRAKSNFITQYFIKHWKNPLHEHLDQCIEYFVAGVDHGDLEYASYNIMGYFYQSFQSGSALQAILTKIERYKGLVKKYEQFTAYNYIGVIHQTILNMRQYKEDPALLVGDGYNEQVMMPQLIEANDRSALCVIYVTKVTIYYLFDEFQKAMLAIKKADEYIDAQVSAFTFPTYYFFRTLTLLALYSNASFLKKLQTRKALHSVLKKFKTWSHFSPQNHCHRLLLLEAEYYFHVKKKLEKASILYDKAIIAAKENEFLMDEALGNELAAKFYLAHGQDKIAAIYLKDARYCYLLWGAESKANDLNKHYPNLLTQSATIHKMKSTESINAAAERLDWETMQKSSLAISSTIVLNELLKKLMKLVIENAGAQKSYLLLKKEDRFYIEAEGYSDKKETKVLESIALHSEQLPLSVINYVMHARESLVLDSALRAEHFRYDPYIVASKVKSLLCMPLMNQAQLTGILYLENNLIEGVFTQDRVQALKLLSSQISMSINNANLFEKTQKLNESLTLLVQAYEPFLPKDYLSLLNKDSIENVNLGDHVQANMTVFFIDIRNFTARSESMTPQENFNFINGFLNLVAPLIRQYHGFVDKYIGDAVMALFPRKADDALDCALHTQKALNEFNKKNGSQEPVAIGIGMNTGSLMLGIVGEQFRMNATVISDAVNIAARIESLTKEYKKDILITEETFKSLSNPAKYMINKVGAAKIKGKKQKIMIYEVQ